MIKYINIVAFFVLVFTLSDCVVFYFKQDKDQLVQDFTEYSSVNLEFSILYPKTWTVFESSESLNISNNRDVLISPLNERLQTRGDYFITLSIVENDSMSHFIDILKNIISLESKIDTSNFIHGNTVPLSTYLKQDQIEEISIQYQELFLEDFTSSIEYSEWEEGIILLTPRQENSSIQKYYILRRMQDSIVVIMEVSFVLSFSDVFDMSKFLSIINSLKLMSHDQ